MSRAWGISLDEGRAIEGERLEYAVAQVVRAGDRGLGNKCVALREREQTEASSWVVGRSLEQSEMQGAEHQHLHRQTGVQQPDQLAESATGQHLVAAQQNERWTDGQLFLV